MNDLERSHLAAQFLLQSPPGEINDVLNDIRNIILDDDLLQQGALPVLREYNFTQFTTVDIPGLTHQSIVSEAALYSTGEESTGEEDEEEWFIEPKSQQIFRFNHISLEASDQKHIDPDPESEPFRLALENATFEYLGAHFLDGVAAVFATQGNPSRFTIQIVDNKYNPANFWSGRWRSEYIIDLKEKTVVGKILVNVHYYEQGNVQLATTQAISLPLPPAITATTPEPSANKVMALIESEEGKYQASLNDTYQEMGEKTFKGLRRALPLTRQKLDWDKVLGYKLGAELTAAKGAFGTS